MEMSIGPPSYSGTPRRTRRGSHAISASAYGAYTHGSRSTACSVPQVSMEDIDFDGCKGWPPRCMHATGSHSPTRWSTRRVLLRDEASFRCAVQHGAYALAREMLLLSCSPPAHMFLWIRMP